MKFQLPSLKLLLKMFITILILIALGLGLLALSHSIPTAKICEHLTESAYTFYEEGSYPRIDSSTSTLDSYTDALMLMEAAYDGPESPIRKALESSRWLVLEVGADSPENNLIVHYASNPDAEFGKTSYPRYWHGFLIFLKPALLLFNYTEIRTLNRLLQFLLCAAIVVLMCCKKCFKAVPAYIVSILMLHPLATSYSLQYSTIFYIFSVFSVLLLIFNDYLTEHKDAIYLFFLTLGAATSYLDFLTYPIATFCMVAVLYICLQRNHETHADIRNIVNLFICWGIGYLIMFASKWILTTIFTEYNIIEDALGAIKDRSSTFIAGQVITRFDAIKRCFSLFTNTPYFIVTIVILVAEIVLLLISRTKFRFDLAFSYLLVLILPLIWYVFAANHSYMHSFFTNKSLVGSVYALLCIFIAWDMGSKHNNTVKKKDKKKR